MPVALACPTAKSCAPSLHLVHARVLTAPGRVGRDQRAGWVPVVLGGHDHEVFDYLVSGKKRSAGLCA